MHSVGADAGAAGIDAPGGIPPPPQRPMIRAILGTRGCVLLRRHVTQQLTSMAQQCEMAVDPDTKAAGAELRDFLLEVEEAARQWRERRVEDASSASGTAEPPLPAVTAESPHPPRSHLSVARVAERLDKSQRWVRHLCDDEVLSATQLGGPGTPWLIEEWSVEDYEAQRRRI